MADARTLERNPAERTRDFSRAETDNLISSDKVDGTKVFDCKGEQIGSIHHLMIGKITGRVEYAVMSFGGFLGMGESYNPLPWDALNYDTKRGGYVVDMDEDKLRKSPSYEKGREPVWDEDYGRSVYTYYGIVY